MIVLDASVALEVLLRTPAATRLLDRLFGEARPIHAPHLLDLEVAQVLRRYAARGQLTIRRGLAALELLAAFPLTRHPHAPLLPRIWALRHRLTAYDAAYVALAEVLGATLLTRDERLARAGGHRARVELA